MDIIYAILAQAIDGAENLTLEESKKVLNLDEIKRSISTVNPGFYLFSHRSGAVSANGMCTFIFIIYLFFGGSFFVLLSRKSAS